MSIENSAYEQQLNFYSRHTRGNPHHHLDSLYFQIGQQLPQFDLEFPKPKSPMTNRILSSHPQENDKDQSVDFDKYQVMIRSERSEQNRKEEVQDAQLTFTIQNQMSKDNEQQPKQEVIQELNRSQDQIPLAQIYDKSEMSIRPIEEKPDPNDSELQTILDKEIMDDALKEVQQSPLIVESINNQQQEQSAKNIVRDMAEFNRPIQINPNHLEIQQPKSIQQIPETVLVEIKKEPKTPQINSNTKNIENSCEQVVQTEMISPRSQTKCTQTQELDNEAAVLNSSPVPRQSSIQSNPHSPKKIPFRLAKKQSKEKRKKAKMQQAQLAETDNTSSDVIKLEGSNGEAPTKKNFSKTFLNKSPIKKLTQSTNDLGRDLSQESHPILTSQQKKKLLSKFFQSNQ